MANRATPRPRTQLSALCAAAVLAALSTAWSEPAWAKKQKTDTVITERDAELDRSLGLAGKQRTVTLSFKQMGAWSSVKLRGVDGYQTLFFPIRSDEVVVGAKLRIAYDYSPALIPELSHLGIGLNGRVAAVEALPKDKGVGNTREINLDPRLFKDNNELLFQLIGHYTRQCEDPYHSSLWLVLSDLGRLELTLASVTGTSDLKNLPAPFFDKRENQPLRIPFVFARTPTPATLQASGVLASWFGAQARDRGMQFPVSVNELPEGNAVVFLQGGETLAGLRAQAASSIALVPHPSTPGAKLLLISGSNDADIARAARAVALAAPTLSGSAVQVTKEIDAAARKPYDAPAWIPTDRPVRLGELVRSQNLRVHAYYPDAIRINYRLPPDVFLWRTPGAPLDLRYRATDLPYHHNSSLNLGHNGNFIQTLPINSVARKAPEAESAVDTLQVGRALRHEQVHIPPYTPVGREQLQFTYHFDVIRQGECMALPPNNLEGAVDAESTIDFSQFPRYAALPNLAYFASLGYPFTRMADLSETAFALPDAPNTDELSLYLTLLGRMGESTGYPALRHRLVSHIDIEKASGQDVVVLGSANNQNLMTKWKDVLPLVSVDGERRVREQQSSTRWTYRWSEEDQAPLPKPPGEFSFAPGASLATVMAFESPMQSGRSVVFMYADKSADLRKIGDLFSDTERLGTVQGDFLVVDDKGVSHTRASATYHVGTLPWWSKLRWFLADQPFVLAFVALLICVLAGALLYRPLRTVLARWNAQRKA
ncbi:MAG: cellulose biosynthesis cyclic di-GMP-binding regulatory protein BcsB [Rhodoferax sp.]